MNPIEFAKYELNRYLATMGVSAEIDLSVDESCFDTSRFPKYDSKYDDAFSISVKDGKGKITATNQRSVLFGVYHYLKRQGCRFLHPEKGGEYVPQIEKLVDVCEEWYAKTRHRGTTDTCFYSGEGRAIDTMLSAIDWLPKIMANSYFNEFTDFYQPTRSKYLYRNNPYKQPDELSREQFEKFEKMIIEATKKRGMLYHRAGHGWNIQLLGGLEFQFTPIDDECQHPEYIALINGERKYYQHRPFWTNLCYSEETIRKQLAQMVWEYSEAHPDIDFLHFWLADYYGNFCECENCRKLNPSDWYIKILNDIDEIFTQHGSDKKIVFLIYFELKFPPIQERIKNEDRFVMMFAPYGRDFTVRYNEYKLKDYGPFTLNTFTEANMDMEIYLSQLRDWKKIFHGDTFVFDYDFCTEQHLRDISGVGYERIPYDNSLVLDQFGLNGHIDCGDTKSYLPTALAMHGLCSGLFYGDTGFDKLKEEYFTGCYGENEPVSAFLEKLYSLLPNDFFWSKTDVLTDEDVKKLTEASAEIKKFRSELFAYTPDHATHRLNCFYMKEYLEIIEFIVDAIIEIKKNKNVDLDKIKEDFRFLVFRKEGYCPTLLSAHKYFNHLSPLFEKAKNS